MRRSHSPRPTYRQVELGGLGVYNVKVRAMAMLIHTFLAQAISPRFATNQYLHSLYRWHVLEHRDLPNPGRPVIFFAIIKDVKDNTPLNEMWVTVKQWYQLLMEKGITHTSDNPDSPPIVILSKIEERHPTVDFPTVYHLTRLFWLSPEQKSFIFKMVQSLLPTRERLARLGKVPTNTCLHCDAEDTTAHLLTCTFSLEVTNPLLNCLRSYFDNLTPEDIVILNIPVQESLELPVT